MRTHSSAPACRASWQLCGTFVSARSGWDKMSLAENVKRASALNGSLAPEKVEHNACALTMSNTTLRGPGLAGKKKESGFKV